MGVLRWEALIQHLYACLSAAGYASIAPDLPSFGKSSGFRIQDYHRALSQPLAGRTLLQMDQTASSIKAFFGTLENAVKSQIWIAVSVYVLVAIVKKRLKLSASLYEILQILSLTMFERAPLDQLIVEAMTDEIDQTLGKQFLLE